MNIVNWTREGLAVVESTKDVIIKIDDTLLSAHTTTLPPGSSLNIKKALSFALEDSLLTDIDDLEFFYKKHNKNYDVVVVEKSLLADIKQTIKEQKLSVKGVYPNFMFVPLAEEGIHYFDEGDYITYRDSKCRGGSLHKELFFDMYGSTATRIEELSKDFMLLNLIQLDVSEFMQKHLKPWTSVLVLCGISLVLYTYSIAISNIALEKEVQLIQAQNTQLFGQIFPDEQRIVDIGLQTESRLKSFNAQRNLRSEDLLSSLEQATLPKSLQSITYDGTLQVNVK